MYIDGKPELDIQAFFSWLRGATSRALPQSHSESNDIFLKRCQTPSVGVPLLGNRLHDDRRDEVNDGLARELRDLRAKYAELKEKYENVLNNFGKEFKEQINECRDKMNEQVLKAEREAAATVEQEKAEAADRIQAAEKSVERVKAEGTAAVNIAQAAEQEAKQRLETAERIAAELRTELQAAREQLDTENRNFEQIWKTMEAELRESMKQIESLQTQVEAARTEMDTEQEAERPDEEPATRPKPPRPMSSVSNAPLNLSSPESESSSSNSSDDSSPGAANASRADQTAARSRKHDISSPSSDKYDDVSLARRRRIQPPPSRIGVHTRRE